MWKWMLPLSGALVSGTAFLRGRSLVVLFGWTKKWVYYHVVISYPESRNFWVGFDICVCRVFQLLEDFIHQEYQLTTPKLD